MNKTHLLAFFATLITTLLIIDVALIIALGLRSTTTTTTSTTITTTTTTTTTTTSTTTTTTTTTRRTTTTSTTTTLYSRCRTNSDCGGNQYDVIRRTTEDGVVCYKLTYVSSCRNPGTPNAECILIQIGLPYSNSVDCKYYKK